MKNQYCQQSLLQSFFAHVFVKTVFSLNIKFKRTAFVSNIHFLYSSFLCRNIHFLKKKKFSATISAYAKNVRAAFPM